MDAMMPDIDLLAIQRKRRREKRCLKCGKATPRAALCETCRATLRYCPRCETIVPLSEASAREARNGRATAYCLPCDAERGRLRMARRTKAEYLAEQAAHQHPKLAQIIVLYRNGMPYAAIAERVGMTTSAMGMVIVFARRTGRWPKELRRQRNR